MKPCGCGGDANCICSWSVRGNLFIIYFLAEESAGFFVVPEDSGEGIRYGVLYCDWKGAQIYLGDVEEVQGYVGEGS
jgi:hypothetical protein